MSYWQLLYHLVWSTEHRSPLITPTLEPIVYKLLLAKATGLGGKVFALGGDACHMHMVAEIPPSIAVAKFIGQVKGVCSSAVNARRKSEVPFYWQDEYGAFSFDGGRLNNYLAYVQRQKEHHANDTIIPILERVSKDGNVINEEFATYAFEDPAWRLELAAMR